MSVVHGGDRCCVKWKSCKTGESNSGFTSTVDLVERKTSFFCSWMHYCSLNFITVNEQWKKSLVFV